MERRSMWSRLLAVVLAVSMVFSSQSMSVFADVVGQITTYSDDANTNDDQQTADNNNDEGDNGNVPDSSEGEEPGSEPETQGESQPESSDDGTDEGQTASVQTTGTINGTDVNLRAQASTNAEVLSKAQEGQSVSILGEVTGDDGNQWYEILYGEGSAFVSAQYVTVNETATDEESEEETQEVVVEEETESETPKKAARRAAKNDSEEADNSTVAKKVLEQAEKYWGDNATEERVDVASLFIVRTDNKGEKVKAGETLSFNVDYTLGSAMTYSYSGEERPMYDTYDNTVIHITLPRGLKVQTDDLKKATVSGSSETGEWTFTLKDTAIGAASSTNNSFTFNVLVEGNGTLEVGHLFGVDDKLIQASIETQFSVKDKSDSGQNQVVKTYTKEYEGTVNGSNAPVTSKSDDVWAIDKTAKGYTVSEDKKTVTLNFDLEVGFRNPAYTEGGDAKKVLSDKDNYAVTGRTKFSKFDLTETLELKDRNGEAITPESITVTPKFGEQKPITFTNGKPVESIPVDTCEGKGLTGVTVDGSAPYYSQYSVAVVYDYDTFIADWNEPEKQDDLRVNNTASISYLLSGESGTPHTDQASASQSLGEVNEPASLTIQKKIQLYDGTTTKIYGSGEEWDWGMVSGDAVFTIQKVDEDQLSPAKLYQRDSEGNYTLLEGNTVALNPVSSDKSNQDYALTSTDGTATVYLEPGTYQITETDEPENTTYLNVTGLDQAEDVEKGGRSTLSAGASVTAVFTNEAEVGKIEITKKGEKGGKIAALGSAEFALYTDEECTKPVKNALGEDVKGTTSNDGTLTFHGLAVKDESTVYYVKETAAPEGYILKDTVYDVTVPQNGTGTLEVTNQYNTAYVKLHKEVEKYDDGTYKFVSVDQTNYRQFENAFTLEESRDNGESWKDVSGFVNQSINESGVWAPLNPLPVYDEKDNLIQYRFKEKLPDGWHGVDEQDGYVYSKVFTLEKVLGKGQKDAHTEIIQNTQNAAITLTKKFVTMEGDGEQTTSNADDNQASFTLYKKVGENGSLEKVSNKTTEDGVISFTDLAIRENEQDIIYYLEEQAVPGYKLELGSDKGNLSISTIDEKTVIGPITFAKTENRLVSFTAYNVEQKLPVKIVKTDSTTDKEVSGAEFTVEITYQTADAEGKKTETRTGVASGSVLLLDGVRTPTSLTVTETKAPEGYQLADQPKTFNIQDASVAQGQQILEFIFEDHPYREVTIQKTVEGNKVTTPVTFEVYTRGQDGNFVPVTGSDEKTKTLISGGKLRLPEGVYYLHEVVPEGNPNEILDPDQFPEKYAEKGEYKDGKFFFGPMKEVPKADGKITEVIDWGTIDNISSVGNVTVTKKEGVKGAALAGATIQIYHYENDKQIVDRTVDTDPKGNATFTGLPVYGTDGKKITYYIVETAAPNGYYINKETSKDPKGNKYHLSTTLVEGKTVTKVNGEESGKDLTIINNPKRDFMITKVARDLWENQFTQKDQLVNGAVVALYRAESADGPYTLQGTQTTGATGQVAWKDLEDGYYVAVEVSCPDVNGKETRPQGGKAYLADRYSEKLPETLDKDELGQYLYVTLDDNKDTEATLVNEIGWTQLKVEKVCNTPEKHEDNHLNGALFELYKQVLSEGTPDNAALNYQQAEKENALTLVGTYSSGTLSDSEGKIMDGWFATDILETGTNIVYWLVEKEAPSGHEILPEEKYILFKQEGTEYTNSSDNGQASKVVGYPIDGVAQVTVTNQHTQGPGDDRFAYIRLYKWADDRGTYKPLGGAKYKLYLADKSGALRQELDEMTTGLESTAIGEGTLTGMAASNRLDFNDFKEWVADDNSDNIAWWEHYDQETKKGSGKFYVRMALVETYAPFGYRADATPHYLIVCFEENQVVYDETYFVSEAGGEAQLASSVTGYPEEDISYRLTNEPLDYYSVTVQKFGYTPDESTLNKTSAELDGMRANGSLSAVPLSVTMRLQRKDKDGWVYCNPKTSQVTDNAGEAEFTTTNGQYTFPNGLMEGSYRIIEERSGDAGYELLYDKDHARYFEVTGQGTIVTMYNPSKFSLSLKKTDWDEKAVTEGVTFSLNDKKQNADGTGTTVFTNLGSDNYKLTEEAAGYSNKYLTAYFQETYPQAVNLVNGTGLYIGYDTTKTSETAEDVTITAIHSPESYGLLGTVTVKNPELGSLTIEKKNADDESVIQKEVTFNVYYQAFDRVNGEYQAQEMPLEDQEPFKTCSTTDGTVEISDLQPGVYYIEETSAPAGFEKDSTPQYVAITGGMNVTVTVGEQDVTTDPEEAISFLDTPQGSLTVTKEINWKSLDPEMQAKEYSFTFTLYDKEGESVGTAATVTQEKPSASFNGLKRGETYYLEEASANGYELESVKQGNAHLTAEKNGYAITIGTTNETDDVAVTVTNAYQYAQYTFKKVDGTDNTSLKGAKFTIKKVEEEGDAAKETVVQGVTWTDHEDGRYTAKIPLSGEGTYRIYETKTPSSDYLLDETQYLEVTLEPGDKKGDSDTADDVMKNFKGAFIEVTKYGNMQQAENPSVLQGAGFTLYERKPGESWSLSQDQVLTDKEGKVRFTVNTGYEYALAETKVPDGYSRLQGIWNGNDKITEETLLDGTILYNLGSEWTLGETYSYEAYNVPNNLELEVRKYDADQEVLPKATVSVYEVSDTTPVQLSQQEVTNLMSTSTALATDVQTTLKTTGEDGREYSYADKTVEEKFGTLESGKTYLIVETGVTAFDGTPYPMTMDDDRVVWYKVLKIPAGETDKQIVELTNVREEMALQLTKTAVVKDQEESQTLPSLFEEGQEIDYTLTPQVTNGFALDSFTLKDPGLTAYDIDGKELDNALKNKYTITSLTIGQASYDASDLSYTGTPDIQATITFKDFEGNPVGEPQTVSVSGGAANVPIPSSAEGSKIASVEITYTDNALQKATGYALGKDFKPGSVNLTVKLDQQSGGEDAKEISKIVNSANAVLTYRGWMGPTSRTETMNKTADNAATTTFGTLKIPSASVSKVLAEGQAEEITLNDSVEYLLTLENTSLDDAALEQAVLVDVLPEGTSVDTSIDYAVITGENPSNLKISQLRQVVFGTNTAILIYFDGNLDKGDSVQVKMTVQTSQSAALYGTTMKNAVFATSAKPGVVTAENKAGASFKGNKDNWAESLSSVATGIIGENRTLALCEALKSERLYGFISSHKDVSWNASSTLTLSKSNYGSEDEVGSYRSDRLARTTDHGTVYYQLAVTNNDPNLYRTGMTIMDVLPREGDLAGKSGASRGSQWPLYFEGITSITAGEKAVNNYEVYYYTGTVGKDTFQAVRDAQNGKPSGWTTTMPDKKEITAFIINLKDTSLAPNENLIVQYTTKVKDYTPEDGSLSSEELEKLLAEYREDGYTNAVNNFSFFFKSYTGEGNKDQAYAANEELVSNTVSATLIPGKVKVGGHVWIDADDDGTQNDGSISQYSDYDIVKNLLDQIEIKLLKYNDKKSGLEGLTSSGQETYNQKSDLNSWYNAAHFIFSNLDPAYSMGETPLYNGTDLNVGDLKGDNPATYILQATLPKDIADVFELAQWGGSYISQEPGKIPPDEQTDSNFKGDSASSSSERFYLWQISTDDNFDDTKDIGFTLHRDLTIEKTAKDDANTKVQGATFDVYGPFEEGTAANQNIDTLIQSGKPTATQTTDEDGKAIFEDLLWFKEYIIVERDPSSGYTVEGASAGIFDRSGTVTPITGTDSAWVLEIPDEAFTGVKQTMDVTNKRQTKVSFNVTKSLNGRDALEGEEFTFELLEKPDSEEPISTVTITATKDPETGKVIFPTGSFAPVTLTGVRSDDNPFIYYIREKLPDDVVYDEETQEYKKDGIRYDTTMYQVKVATRWDADSKKLVAGTPEYKVYDPISGEVTVGNVGTARFTNTYTASGSWTPEATKTLTGRDMKNDESYGFSVREIPYGTAYSKDKLDSYREVATGTVSGGEDGEAEDIIFTSVSYTLDDLGSHTYAIYEKNGDQIGGITKGVTYSDNVILVTVTVRDNGNGTLTATPDYGTSVQNFSNVYTSSATAYLNATKKVTGGSIKSGFEFDIYTDENLSILDTTHVTTKDQTENAGEITNPVTNVNGTIRFSFKFSQDDLKGVDGGYPKSKDVVFYIKEAASGFDGYTGSDEVYKLTYTLTDDGYGKLDVNIPSIQYKASADGEWGSLPEAYGETMTFTNAYEASGSAQVGALKVLNGRETALAENEFEFSLTALDGAPLDENVTYTVKNAANGSVTFPKISYDMDDLAVTDQNDVTTYQAKTFKYLLAENVGSDTEHYDYDDTQYEVWITVSDKGDGTLDTSVSYQERVYDEGSTTEYELEAAALTVIGEEPNQQNVPSFTNQYTIEGSLLFSGKKILNEQEIMAGQFTFILTSEAKGNAEQDADNLAKDVENPDLIQKTDVQAGGNFSFNPLNYDQDDVGHTYHYTLTEAKETDSENYDYDETVYEFEVTISDDHGALKTAVKDITKYPEDAKKENMAVISENGASVVVSFTNHYEAKGGLELQAQKTVENRVAAVGEEEFTFEVFEVDRITKQLGTTPVATGKTAAGGEISVDFGDSYYQIISGMSVDQRNQVLGEHTYILKEQIPAGADADLVYDEMVYSNEAYKVIVNVTDNRNGTLKAAVTSRSLLTIASGDWWKEEGTPLGNEEEMTFTNTYLADGETPIILDKSLTGKRKDGIQNEEFSFQAQKVSAVGAEPAANAGTYTGTTVAATEDNPYESTASITIRFNQDDLGEKVYKLTETATTAESVSISSAVYYVKFTVKDAGNHELEAEDIIYYQADGNGWKELTGNDVPEFVNAYTATGTISLEGKKELTGNRAKALEDGEFTFEIVDENDQVVSTGTNDADGKITFTAIDPYPADDQVNTYTEADIGETYTYTIREVDKADDAVSVETEPIEIKIKVEDGDGKGQLSVNLTGDVTEEEIFFTNHYNASGNAAFEAGKILEGGRGTAIDGDEFKFVAQLVSVDGDQQATYNGSYDEDTQKVVFDTMTFDEYDIGRTYTYCITELDGTDQYIEYSDEAFYATVSIADSGIVGEDGEGILTATVKYYEDSECINELTNGITFTNQYKATGSVELVATKILQGRPMAAGEFIFGIYEITEDSEGKEIRTQVLNEQGDPLYAFNDKDGNVKFAEINYDQDDQGIHKYEIVEFNRKAESIIYDDQPVKVSVNVLDKNGNGTLTVNATYETSENAHTVFENIYHADGTVTFQGTKVLLGNRAMEIQENEFTYTVTENGQEVATGKTLKGGIIEFTTIEYDENDVNDPDDPNDVHTYVISENMGKDESVSYTAPDVTVTVKVTDNTDGTLTAVPMYPEDGIVFENQYFADGEITLTGSKELLGNRGTELTDGEFQFEVRELDENGNPEEEPVAYGENKADGTITFDPITYKVEQGRSDIGTHVYVINETAGKNAAIDYTEDLFKVTVEVTDLGRGALEAAVVAEESDEVLFQNHYHASGEVLLDNFTKVLNGSPLAAGQFTFELADADGNVLQTVTNTADGSIPFETLTYDESDIGQEYTYTVTEVNNNVTGVAYDTNSYTVLVAVADSEDSDGTLDITTTIRNGEETIEGGEGALPQITFTNTFGGTVTLTKQNDSQQVLSGAEFQLYARTEGADTYEVYVSEGNAEGRYTTDVNGQIQITDLPANDYYFVETKAPQGYVIETDEAGQPLHYDFTIGVQDGVTGIAENAVANASLTVTDPGATTGSIQVTKRVGRIGDNFDIVDLVAVNETYYVGLFLDAAGTQPYGTDNVKAIQMNGVSVSQAVTFDNLPSGTYYVLETDAQGNPVVMNETQTTADGGSYYCTLEEGQNNQVTVDLTVSEEPGAVMLTNVYLEFSQDYYWDATIDITKQVLKDGEEATADDTFYAGVYQMAEDGSYELLTEVELEQNGTVTVTGLGGPIGESMTYYVFETDGNGNRVSEDPAFLYAVSGEGSVTVTQDNTAGSITITNEFEEEEPTEKPTEEPSEKPTEPDTKPTETTSTEPAKTTSTKATKTGDTTDLTVELLLMALAAVLMGTSVYARKRRRSRR